MTTKSSFAEFTNLYELSKTLRFELKPIWVTEQLIYENWLRERDELRDKDYDIIKPIFDQLHDTFIRESLDRISINWEELFVLIKNHKKALEQLKQHERNTNKEKESEKLEKQRQELEKDYENRLEEVRKQITKNYEITAEKWKNNWKDEKWKSFIKEEWYKILTEAWILKVLKKTFENKDEVKKLIHENEKALEMLWKKIEYYKKKIDKENDFSWWWKLYKWEKQESLEENFDKISAKNYLDEILLKIKEKNIEETQKQVLSVIENFESFWTYFWWFNQNRENYYSSDDKSTWVANRIVNQNFVFFLSNIELLSKIKISLTEEEKAIFEANNYSHYLSQDWIDTYNSIIWRKSDSKNEWEKWINQRLNEYSQQNNEKRIQLTPLYKQIWSIKAKVIPFEFIETDEDFKETLRKIIDTSVENVPLIVSELTKVFESNELDKIWISKNKLNFLSNRYFSNWYAVAEKGVQLKVFKPKKKSEEWDDYSIPSFISLQDFKQILEEILYIDNSEIDEDKRVYFFKKHLEENRNWMTNNWEFFKKIFREDIEKRYSWKDENVIQIELENGKEVDKTYTIQSFTTLLWEVEVIKDNFGTKDKEHRKTLKAFADKAIFIFWFLRIFKVDKDKIDWETGEFYEKYYEFTQKFFVTKYYDAIRNYLTKKDFSEEKIKLKFDKWNLLGWWSEDYAGSNGAQYNGYIFRKKDGDIFKYYLWISNNAQIFNHNKNPKVRDIDNKWYEKMNILALKTTSIFGSSYESEYWNSYNEDKQKLSEIDLIKKVQEVLRKKYVSKYKWLKEVINKTYEKLWNFVSDINLYWDYSLTFEFVNWKYLEQQVYWENSDKFLYLFEIVSKDSTSIEEKKKRFIENWKNIKDFKEPNKDLQTIYWENILSGTPKFKLNWKAEILFRRASKEVKNKNDLEDIKKHLKKRNENAIESKRYTENKTIFHCPTIVWYGNKQIKWPKQFNEFTNWILSWIELSSLHIIWIDRGEKHLAFYSVINALTGKIVEQWSLNIVNGINYEKLLTEKAWSRLKARQEWETIGNIKNLKEWYISHVVKKIADLVLDYNWIVVMEKLNKWFKQWRQKIEQSVYQNLEVALAKKLSYLVLKDRKEWELGSITQPYQLCPFAKNYVDIETAKQWGIMFYTTAAYTSVTDPITWWRKSTYLKKRKADEMRSQIIDIFSEIWFDESKKAYFFKLHWNKFTLYSGLERFRGRQNKNSWKWENNQIFTTQELDKLFSMYSIDKNREISSQIEEKNEKELPAKFFETFIWIFDVISQIRNTSKEKEDFLISPVEPFFDSRKYFEKLSEMNWEKFEKQNSIELPTSWDANGAFNIARKGLMMLKRIHENPKIKSDKLFISNEDWDKVVTDWDSFTQK